MHKPVQDPIVFVDNWARDIPIVLPVQSEVAHARKSLGACATLLYSCPLFLNLRKREQRRYIRTWLSTFSSTIGAIGYIATTVLLKDIGNAFLRIFKLGEDRPTFESVDSLTNSPLFSAIDWLTRNSSAQPRYAETVDWIYEFHVFLSKTPLSRPDLEEPSETDWITRQNKVKADAVKAAKAGTILRPVVNWLMGDFQPSDVRMTGRHGPGATALQGVKDVAKKNKNYRASIQTTQLTVLHPVDQTSELRTKPKNSKLRFATKDASSLRPIGMEGPTEMYAQQALKRALYFMNDDMGIAPISRFIKYRDQTMSQRLALMGSSPKESGLLRTATLDSSAASDWLSSDLVTNAFSGDLLHRLLAGRTWYMDTSRGPQEIGMYAGMGNALTFPVQSIIFTAFAVLAVSRALYQKWFGVDDVDDEAWIVQWRTGDLDQLPGHTQFVDYVLRYLDEYPDSAHRRLRDKCFSRIRIYGDDVIVPELDGCTVPILLKYLSEAGLVVNEKKSFYSPLACREACGTFAFNGVDITPLRFRVPVVTTAGLLDVAAYEGWRSLANFAFTKGRAILYRYCVKAIREAKPLVSSEQLRRKSHTTGYVHTKKLVENEAVKYVRRKVVLHRYPFSDKIEWPVFEEYRSLRQTPLGVLSSRGSSKTHLFVEYFGVPRHSVTTLASKSIEDTDNTSERYHYLQWDDDTYFAAMADEFQAQDYRVETSASVAQFILHGVDWRTSDGRSHGKIPRGIRFVKRNAYKTDSGPTGWEWAPN